MNGRDTNPLGGPLETMVIYLTRRKALVLVAVLLLVGSAGVRFAIEPATKAVVVLLTGRLVPIYRVDVPDKRMAVSFDAMWGTERTDKLLGVLRKHGVKTTFFLGGSWVEKYPDYVRKLVAEGHEVGNHTYSHPHLNALSPDAIREELERNGAMIAEITGKKPFLFRPPFGEYGNKVIETAKGLGYQTIQWSIDSHDWMDVTADYMVNRVLKAVGPGDIVLFHNDGKHTAEAVDLLIPELSRRGFRLVPVSELIYHDSYYIESHSGTQRKLRPSAPQAPGQTPSQPPRVLERDTHGR